MSKPDPHRAWLQELRVLSVRISDGLSDDQPGTVPNLREQITTLQHQIIETDPNGKDGVLAQVCQSARNIDPLSASNFDPLIRHLLPA